MRNLLIIFLLTVVINSAFGQMRNFAYQLYMYDNLYSNFDEENFTAADFFAFSDNKKQREELMADLQAQITYYDIQIKQIENALKQIDNDLQLAKNNYSKVLFFLFLTRKAFKNDFIFILSATTFQQAFKRYNFLKLFLSYLELLSTSIQTLQNSLEIKKKILKNKKKLRADLLSMYQEEKQKDKLFFEKELKMIKNLEQKETDFRLQLEKTIKGQKKLKELILSFDNLFVPDTSEKLTADFEQNKGNLPLPIDNAIIISSFGVHKHKKFPNITVKNDGIDLFSKTDTLVKSVFKGKIIKVVTLPDGIKAIIIRHGIYFTVYKNLNAIFVIENQYVFEKQALGTISRKTSDYSFPVLNFQIWKRTTKLNPAEWLKF